MADRSKIEWTDASWNPVRASHLNAGPPGWHCEHVSEGCRNCYAEALNKRLGTGFEFKPGYLGAEVNVFLDEKTLLQPLHWKRPRKIFVGSMTDIFADFVTDEMLDKIFAVAALCPQHTFQFLTKRSARMRKYMAGRQSTIPYLGRMPLERIHIEAAGHMQGDGGYMDALKAVDNIYSLYLNVPWPLPNVWLGVSCEDQATADERIPDLLATPAAIRFISAEPLLGPIDLTQIYDGSAHREIPREEWGPLDDEESPPALWWDALTGERTIMHGGMDGSWSRTDASLDLVICGGESGRNARPMHPDWARSLRNQCSAAGTAFFFKQWGEYLPVGQNLPGCGKVHGATCIKPGRMKLHYRGTPRQPPQYAFAERGVEFASTADGCLTFRVGKKAAGRLLDGIEHNAFPEGR